MYEASQGPDIEPIANAMLEVFKKRPAGHSFVPPASHSTYCLQPLNVKYIPFQACFISTKADPCRPELRRGTYVLYQVLPF